MAMGGQGEGLGPDQPVDDDGLPGTLRLDPVQRWGQTLQTLRMTRGKEPRDIQRSGFQNGNHMIAR